MQMRIIVNCLDTQTRSPIVLGRKTILGQVRCDAPSCYSALSTHAGPFGLKHSIALIFFCSAFLFSVTVVAQDAAVNTSSQAQQGAAIYAQQCAACHGDTLEGGAAPALKGTAFNATASAQHLSIKSLLDVISRTMPVTAPGSLKQEEYAAVTAFVLRQSGLLADDRPLSAQSADPGDIGLGIEAAAAMRTASQGVYTDAQMAQGKTLYSDNCLQCHGGELDGVEDAPPLAGKLFISRWGALPVGTLHAFIDKSMPPGNGGALGAVSEAAVVAYILYKNNFPAGSTPLPADPAGLNSIITK
jgi:mono/diheme cytochrome c family protein